MFPFARKKPIISSQPQYSTDWVSGHTSHWLDLFSSLQNRPQTRYLEIGVFEGRSLIWMMENILTHSTSRADVIDNFYDKTERRLRSNLKWVGLENKVNVYKGESSQIIPRLDFQYDLVYVDGCHCPPHIMTDGVLAWNKLKPGGFLIFDDYQLEKDHHIYKSPQVAIDSFVAVFEAELEVRHKDYSMILQKTSSYRHR